VRLHPVVNQNAGNRNNSSGIINQKVIHSPEYSVSSNRIFIKVSGSSFEGIRYTLNKEDATYKLVLKIIKEKI
jgi:hypothetical protein